MQLPNILRKSALAVALLAGGFTAAPTAQAVPILGGVVVVETTGDVIATFLGHTAGFTNELYLSLPTTFPGVIFNNQTTPAGTSVNLGSFTAGTELVFQIHVVNTGFDFYTGPASRNPDSLFHAVVDNDFSPTATYVGFEDIFGGGDLDYDDLNFSFTNTRGAPASAPEGSTSLILLGLGLAGVQAVRRFAFRK